MNKEDNLKRTAYLKNIVLNMPEKPGTYQFYDNEKTIIYVGKAKNLKRRVSSYFHKEVDRLKQRYWFLRLMTFHILLSKQKKMHFL